MSHDRLGIFRVPHLEGRFIVVVMNGLTTLDKPTHTSSELAQDEAKNLLRHYNLTDTEIDSKLAAAQPRTLAHASDG